MVIGVITRGNQNSKIKIFMENIKTVLVVDDDEALTETISEVLKRKNYNVLIASNGQEALEICKSNSNFIDLVISDVEMPIMNGVEFVNKLRIIGFKKPIIVMSGMFGFNEKPSEKEWAEKGIKTISKAFNPYALLDMVVEALDSKSSGFTHPVDMESEFD